MDRVGVKKLSVPVHVISLDTPQHMKQFERLCSNVTVFPAVDMRGADPDSLYESGYISPSAAHVLKRGRKWHHELSSAGCVGLHQSVLRILEKGSGWCVICEDDCFMTDAFPERVAHLIHSYHTKNEYFDAAVFGPYLFNDDSVTPHPSFDSYSIVNKQYCFYGLHCVLYSPNGRRKVASLMRSPQDTQLDAFLSQCAEEKKLTLLLEVARSSAYQQNRKKSTLQTDCQLCDVPSRGKSASMLQLAVMIILLLALAFAIESLIRSGLRLLLKTNRISSRAAIALSIILCTAFSLYFIRTHNVITLSARAF
jgi:GR25 family glycosyltransferase involved in LPS biosynthesis